MPRKLHVIPPFGVEAAKGCKWDTTTPGSVHTIISANFLIVFLTFQVY